MTRKLMLKAVYVTIFIYTELSYIVKKYNEICNFTKTVLSKLEQRENILQQCRLN